MAESIDDPANPNEPQVWIGLAESKLEHARLIFRLGLYDDAISAAYYAMYYAAKAALLTEGLDLRKHSSAVLKLRELFVLTGKLDAEYLRLLSRVQTARERSDYNPLNPASKEDAAEVLKMASSFIARIKEIIARKNSVS
jgi:uncharacterized protein (UPF0332 family)